MNKFLSAVEQVGDNVVGIKQCNWDTSVMSRAVLTAQKDLNYVSAMMAMKGRLKELVLNLKIAQNLTHNMYMYCDSNVKLINESE